MVAPYAWPRSYKVSRLWNRRAHTSGAGKYLRTLVSITTGAKLIDETCLEETRSLPSLDAWLLSRPCLIGRMLLIFSRFVTLDVEEKKKQAYCHVIRCHSSGVAKHPAEHIPDGASNLASRNRILPWPGNELYSRSIGFAICLCT